MKILQHPLFLAVRTRWAALNARKLQGIVVMLIFVGVAGAGIWNTWTYWNELYMSPADARYLNKDRLQRLALRGDVESQYQLGNLYFAGHNVTADEKQAVHWYTEAGKHGHPLAQYQLGLILQLNNDDAGAFEWLKQAADQNIVDAQNRVGTLYVKGTTKTPSNGLAAAQYFSLAAEQGHSGAMHNLAHLYKNGAGIPKDITGAMFWMRLATMVEKDPKVRAAMSDTLSDWEKQAKKSEIAAAEKAAQERFAKGFKLKGTPERHPVTSK